MQALSDTYENCMTGEEIRQIRMKYGLTQEEFGRQLGLSKRQVWALEHNEKNIALISEQIRCTKFVQPRRDYGISGERMAQIRQQEGLSQEKFGEKLGLTKRQVWSMEHSKHNSRSRRELVKAMEPPGEDMLLSGLNLKMIQEMTGLSQAKFAKILGLKQSSYFYMEDWEMTSPELTAKVRKNFPEEFEWVTTRFSVKKVVKEDAHAPDVGLTGSQIKTIRMFAGLNQTEFAMRIGISQPGLSALERSSKGNVRLEAVISQEFPKEYRMVTAKSTGDDVQILSGMQLQRIRKKTGLSQSRFGARIGLSQSGQNNCEHRDKITLTVSARIRAVFPEEYEAVINIDNTAASPTGSTGSCKETESYVAAGIK